jgi:hypothetical protein
MHSFFVKQWLPACLVTLALVSVTQAQSKPGSLPIPQRFDCIPGSSGQFDVPMPELQFLQSSTLLTDSDVTIVNSNVHAVPATGWWVGLYSILYLPQLSFLPGARPDSEPAR